MRIPFPGAGVEFQGFSIAVVMNSVGAAPRPWPAALSLSLQISLKWSWWGLMIPCLGPAVSQCLAKRKQGKVQSWSKPSSTLTWPRGTCVSLRTAWQGTLGTPWCTWCTELPWVQCEGSRRDLEGFVLNKGENLFCKKIKPTQTNLSSHVSCPCSFKQGFNKIIFLWCSGFFWK